MNKKITPNLMRYIKSIEETPQWLSDNLYLRDGYRVGYTCVSSNLKSLFHRHNDIMNIWTHLVGAIFFLIVLVYLMVSSTLSTSLYNELKRDIKQLNISDRIQQSYNNNISPIIVSVKSYGDHIGNIKFSKVKSQLLTSIENAERDYLNIFNDLIEKFHKQEIDFLTNFDIEYERAIQNIMIMQANFLNRFHNLKNLTMNTFKHANSHIDHYFTSDNLLKKLSNAIQLDLEIYPIAIFIICAFLCLGASAVYHTFYVMSPEVNRLLLRFDMAGINILIFGSVYAVLFYFFYCNPNFKTVYIACSFVSCFAVFIVSMGDKIHSIKYIKLKGLLFGGLGVSNATPLVHACFMGYQSNYTNDNIPINRVFIGLALMGALYLIGLTFYVFKLPERYYPKKFDIWFNSHVIWHLFVFAAACTHLYSVIVLYEVRKNIPCLSWL